MSCLHVDVFIYYLSNPPAHVLLHKTENLSILFLNWSKVAWIPVPTLLPSCVILSIYFTSLGFSYLTAKME